MMVSLHTPTAGFDAHRIPHVANLKAPHCMKCDIVREIAFCADLTHDEVMRLAELRCYATLPAGFTIFREGDRVDHFYSISTGSVKLYKLLPDGRRQIIGFLFSGDVFGLGTNDGYCYTAETITPTHLCRFPQRKMDALMEEIPKLERRMFNMAVKDLVAAQEQMLLLGRKTAREKVASFLIKLSLREERLGQPHSTVALPMSRADIADYLGLTIETVSRTFTQLKRDSIIGLPASGHCVLNDRPALKALADGV